MIHVFKYRILHESEFRKFEKLYRIFRHFTEEDLDLLISGRIHLRRSPGPRKRKDDKNGNNISD
jgi:hypothetical protein